MKNTFRVDERIIRELGLASRKASLTKATTAGAVGAKDKSSIYISCSNHSEKTPETETIGLGGRVQAALASLT
jgi:hypothetical protein